MELTIPIFLACGLRLAKAALECVIAAAIANPVSSVFDRSIRSQGEDDEAENISLVGPECGSHVAAGQWDVCDGSG